MKNFDQLKDGREDFGRQYAGRKKLVRIKMTALVEIEGEGVDFNKAQQAAFAKILNRVRILNISEVSELN